MGPGATTQFLGGIQPSGRARQLFEPFHANTSSQKTELEGFSLRPNFAVKVIDFSCFSRTPKQYVFTFWLRVAKEGIGCIGYRRRRIRQVLLFAIVHFDFSTCRPSCTDFVSLVSQTTFKMKHLAAYLLLTLGGNEAPSAADVKQVLSSVGIEADDSRLETLISELKGKSIEEVRQL